MSLLSIFGQAIAPIVTIAVVGFVLGSVRDIDADPLTAVTIYVLVPALIFHTLATTALAGSTLLAIGASVLAFVLLMTVVAGGLGRLLGEHEPILGTFILVSVFSNAGNYGIPLSEFAFGAVGRATAVVYIAVQSLLMYTLGVYVAARGEGTDPREGARTVFTVPLIYAVAAALVARAAGVVPPADAAVMQQLKLVGDSAIPIMLLILGIELSGVDYGSALRRVSPAAGLKLLVAPVVAVAVALVVDFDNPTVARVFVLECSTPAAVTTLILSAEFAGGTDGLSPTEYASTAIFVTTVVSVPLLTALIAVLRSGMIL